MCAWLDVSPGCLFVCLSYLSVSLTVCRSPSLSLSFGLPARISSAASEQNEMAALCVVNEAENAWNFRLIVAVPPSASLYASLPPYPLQAECFI